MSTSFCENLEYETQMGYKENLYWNTLWIAMELASTVSRTEQMNLAK